MDRSYLSKPDVVAASREFVCIRLATYEDQKEAEFLQSLYLGRSGQLENTTFAILSPDATRKLTIAGRGPFHAFRNSSAMASRMSQITRKFPDKQGPKERPLHLPLTKGVAIALNVAAADNLPLIILHSGDASQLERFQKTIAAVVRADSLVGQFVFVTNQTDQELKPITGRKTGDAILVVEPGQFGLSGRVVAQFDDPSSTKEIERRLINVVTRFPRRRKDRDTHVELGIQLGVDWKSKIPETDPMSVRAKQRVRGR